MDKPPAPGRPQKTLSEQEIVTSRTCDRRAVIRAAAAAAVATVVAAPAAAQGISDRDAGPGADPPGRGRHGTYTGRTDQDPTDPANGGRGGAAPQRRQTGVTDRDAGPGADPPGGGRGGTGSRSTGISDTDSGPGADPAGHGRGRGRVAGQNDRDVYERPWNADSGPSDQDPSDPYGHGRRAGGAGGGNQGGQSRLSDNDTGPGSDPQGEGRGTAAWARRHAQGPTGGRPPQPRPPATAGRPAADVVDIGVGRNDAARVLADMRDSIPGGRGDASNLNQLVK
jgi:hypothetical protein